MVISPLVPAIVCFARDTEIQTKSGRKLIQKLCLGEEVLTHDNGYQPIRWISSKSVNGTGSYAPVVFTAGSLGKARELVVSPQHRPVFSGYRNESLFGANEHFVIAKHLVNGDTIYRAENRPVEYFHILFDKHEVNYASDVPAESFHPNAVGLSGLHPDGREEIFTLFPELRRDTSTYGDSALPTLKQHETAVLCATA